MLQSSPGPCPSIFLYRRHYRAVGKCSGGYASDFRNYETDELRRGWKKCHCPIYADGTLTCRACNLDKGTRTTREYEEELRRRAGGN